MAFPYIVKLFIGLNLILTGLMWAGEPVVVDMPMLDNFGVGGLSFGIFIFINTEYALPGTRLYNVILKHEYAHYIQQCYFTPLGLCIYNTINTAKNFLQNGSGRSYLFYYYKDNYFEERAFELQNDPNFLPPKHYLHLRWGWSW